MEMKLIVIFCFVLGFFLIRNVYSQSSGVTVLNTTVAEGLYAELINFTIPNVNIPQGQAVEFDVEVKNTGNVDLNASSEVKIYNIAEELVDTVISNNVTIAYGETKVIKTFWNTDNNPLGSYKAIARVLYDGKNTTTQTKYFSITSAPTPPTPPGVPIVPPPAVVVEFVRWPTLREVAQGQAIVLGIEVKNIGNSSVYGLGVEISGIPKEWATVTPKVLDLDVGAKSGFTIAIGVPSNALPGDYKVLMTLSNEAVHAENFFILRVRQFVPEYDKPMFMRIVDLDVEARKTNVDIIVNNPNKRTFPLVEVIERIPKELANTSDIIEFKTVPTEIISKDPLVQWNLIDLKAGEERKISYSVPKILEEFSKYIYWPLEQVNIITAKLPRGFRIADAKIPISYPGRTSIFSFTIENTEEISYNFSASIELPVGWKIEQSSIEGTIQARQRKTISFNFFVPGETTPGTYLLKLYLSWDGSETTKEYSIIVQSFVPLTIFLYVVIILVAVVLIYLLLRKLRRKRIPMEEKLRRVKREITKE